MKFYLCSATQNTFFFISESELQSQPRPTQLRNLEYSELAKVLCHHYGSNGADGFVVVRNGNLSDCDFEWDFYNKDGSSADMCGNASRCMAFFVKEKLGFSKPTVKFKSLAGIIEVKYLDQKLFSVHMPDHKTLIWNEGVKNLNEEAEIKFSLINTGVPHAVVFVEDLNKEKLLPLTKILRHKNEFGPAGANVSFIKIGNESGGEQDFQGVTFERGVENFTASCGTGVVAMAVALFRRFQEKNLRQVEIKTPGGLLKVSLDSSNNFCWLTGPAELIEVVEGWS